VHLIVKTLSPFNFSQNQLARKAVAGVLIGICSYVNDKHLYRFLLRPILMATVRSMVGVKLTSKIWEISSG